MKYFSYFEGIGIPLTSKSFKKVQPQLSSPLSPVDYKRKFQLIKQKNIEKKKKVRKL